MASVLQRVKYRLDNVILFLLYHILQTYPGHIGAANVTLSSTGVTYAFRVRASNLVNGIENHGEFSQITPESTLFVPSLSKFVG